MTNRSPVWHPFTQHGAEPPPIPVSRTEGAWIETTDSRRILDGISSWWVVTHGHRHPAIMRAIQKACESLDQVIFAGFTHEPAEQLSRALVRLAPPGLDHVFYSDSGSTSVEVALKMALGASRNRGEGRTEIVVMQHSYHGDTIGAMSVGARGIFNVAYEALLFGVQTIPFPRTGHEQDTLDAFEAAATRRKVAAIIVEPLVLGAGGMLMYEPRVLTELRRIADATGTLLIADEVMTGWGRTGSLFACEQAAITPDILCTSKGLTSGSLPLAATLASAAIFEAHLSADRSRAFFHSSSYTANPIACAAALANVGVWDAEPVRERVASLAAAQRHAMAALAEDDVFTSPRVRGTIAAVDLRVPDPGYLAGIGAALRRECLARGVLLRPLGNTIYILPPYCVSETEIGLLYAAVREAAHACL